MFLKKLINNFEEINNLNDYYRAKMYLDLGLLCGLY